MRNWCLTCAAGVILLQWGDIFMPPKNCGARMEKKFFLTFGLCCDSYYPEIRASEAVFKGSTY